MKNTIPLQPAQSSQIHATGYDPTTKTLAVQFKRKAGPGSVYLYQNVTPEQHQAFQGAESIGKHFGAVFKADPEAFPCTKCEDEEAEEKT